MALKITSADKWVSKCVREAANWTCCRCGTKHQEGSQGLHASHGYSRGNWGVRFNTELNIRAQCYGCHMSEGGNWMYRLLTEHERALLEELKNDTARGKLYRKTKGVGEIAKHYREQYEFLRHCRGAGAIGVLPIEDW